MRRPPFNPSDAGASAAGSIPAGPQSPSELLRFADAEDRMQARPPCGQSLSGDEGVGLAVMLAPLRMSDDDSARSCVFNSPLPKSRFQFALGARAMVTTSAAGLASMSAIRPKTGRPSVWKTKMNAARASAASLGVPWPIGVGKGFRPPLPPVGSETGAPV